MIVDPLIAELREKIPGLLQHDRSSADRIVASVRDVVSSELQNLSQSRSLSATPVQSPAGAGMHGSVGTPTVADLHKIIQNQIAQGRVDEAFQTALSASNLSLVVQTCEMVNPMQIFNQNPCPISQATLLSLIQQLSKSRNS